MVHAKATRLQHTCLYSTPNPSAASQIAFSIYPRPGSGRMEILIYLRKTLNYKYSKQACSRSKLPLGFVLTWNHITINAVCCHENLNIRASTQVI
jgi:hypothetical protein